MRTVREVGTVAGVVVGTLSCALVLAQSAPPQEMRARELFLLPQVRAQQTSSRTPPATPVPRPTPPPAAPQPNRQGTTTTAPPRAGQTAALVSVAPVPLVPQLAFRYSLRRRVSNTRSEEVDTDTKFSAGDAIRINVILNDLAYLYIGQESKNGTWVSLFPGSGESNLLSGYAEISIPRKADEWMVFDATPEAEQVYVAASRRPITDPQQILAASRRNSPAPRPAPNAGPSVQMAGNITPISRGLVVQKVDTAAAQAEHAVYVAAGSGSENEAIAHFTLQRRP